MMGAWALGFGLLGCLLVLVPWSRWFPAKEDGPHWSSRLPGVGVLLAWVPFLYLVQRFVVHDASIAAVHATGGAGMPLLYRVAATWSARTGPLLLWSAFTVTLAWWWRAPFEDESEPVAQRRIGLLGGFGALLMLLSMHLRPFASTAPGAPPGELSPLLQTDLMVVHPPLVFLAYAYCMSIAATGVATVGREETGLLQRLVRQARPAFFVTTLAIGLGGLWAYLILDWGGYWAWDPVETGSFLPWLALAVMAHMRTVPRRVPDLVLRGVAMLTGVLALFATLVTRAGGAWASSVHTFVVEAEGSAPTDAYGRIVALAIDAGAGVEVMAYLMVMLLLFGWWLADLGLRLDGTSGRSTLIADAIVPVVVGAAVLAEWLGLSSGAASGLLGRLVPGGAWALLVLVPWFVTRGISSWPTSYARPKGVPVDWVLCLLIAVLGGDVLLALLWLALFSPLALSDHPTKLLPVAVLGVGLALAAAWTDIVALPVAAMMLLPFVAPWLMDDEEGPSSTTLERLLKRLPMWAGAGLSGIMLVLTLTILLGSIDQIHFAAHEVYGSVILAAAAGSMLLYGMRRQTVRVRLSVLLALFSVSVIGALAAPGLWGGDALEGLSRFVMRGHLAWVVLPTALVALPVMAMELVRVAQKRSSTPWWKRIPVQAHVVHVGLLLLLAGHVFSTTLVDRGDPSHRITMLRDEAVEVDGLSYTFTGVELVPAEELNVGDGAVHVVVEVRDGDRLLGVAEPGMTRFDASGFPRSEVDVIRGLTGDIVLIFDFTQAGDLMQQVAFEGEDSVDAVRVTVYRLPQSHLVWAGWSMMLLGMASLAVAERGSPRPKPAA